MLLSIIVAAVVSTATPARHFDQSWGELARSGHYHGSWRLDFPDGTQRRGDWVIVERGPSGAIHLFDSTDAQQQLVYSRSEGVTLPRSTTAARGGVLHLDTRAVVPSLADEEMLFERKYRRSLAAYFNAEIRREAGALVIVMPFRDTRRLGNDRRVADRTLYTQEVVLATAHIRVTKSGGVEITARETSRTVEDCSSWVHAATSCGFYPPTCTPRK